MAKCWNKDESTRAELSGEKGVEMLTSCDSDFSYNENLIIFTNALCKTEDADIRQGLSENICRLIINRSSIVEEMKIEIIEMCHNMIDKVIDIISSDNSNLEDLIDCFLNVARKPSNTIYYCCYIPALMIIRGIIQRCNLDFSEEEEVEFNSEIVNLMAKRIFSFLGNGPTTKPALQLCFPLIAGLTAQDFHSGFGKCVLFQIQRFPNDSFQTLSSLCYLLRFSDGIEAVQSLEFHFEKGINLSSYMVKHLCNHQPPYRDSAVSFCVEFLFMDPMVMSSITNILVKELKTVSNSSEDNKINFYVSLHAIARKILRDVDFRRLPQQLLHKMSSELSQAIHFILEKQPDQYDLLKPSLEGFRELSLHETHGELKISNTPSTSSMAKKHEQEVLPVSIAEGKADSSSCRKIRSTVYPGVVFESKRGGPIYNKIQSNSVETPFPGVVLETKKGTASSRKIQLEESPLESVVTDAKSGSVFNRIIQTEEASLPDAVAGMRTDTAFSRKIQQEKVSMPGVVAETKSGSLFNQKVQTEKSSIPCAVGDMKRDNAYYRKIGSKVASMPGVKAETKSGSVFDRKIQKSSMPCAFEETKTDNVFYRKIQSEVASMPGVKAETKSGSAFSRKIQTEEASMPFVYEETKTDSAFYRKIEPEGVSMCNVKAETKSGSVFNRKIQSEESSMPYVEAITKSGNALDRKIQSEKSTNPVVMTENNAVYSKIKSESRSTEPSSFYPGTVAESKINSDICGKLGSAYDSFGLAENEQKKNMLMKKKELDEDLFVEKEKRKEKLRPDVTNAEDFRISILRAQRNEKKQKKTMKNEKSWDSEHDLAVAIAVDDDRIDEYDPIHAEEYDPDYKPKIYKNPRIMTRMIGCFIFIIVNLTVIIVTFTKQTVYEGPALSPTSSPTTIRDTLGISDYISSYFSYNFSSFELKEPISMYEKFRLQAIDWVVNKDGMQLTISDSSQLIQRYILMLLYISTRGPLWKHCAGYFLDFTNVDSDNTGSGNAIYNNTHDSYTCNYTSPGSDWTDTFMRWGSEANECDWFGVVCTAQNDTLNILLQDNGLVGTIPWELSKLYYLRVLWLNANSLSGQIPPKIFHESSHLADLQLHGNFLTGCIPEEIYALSSLQNMNLAINKLTGTISNAIGNLRNLKGIHLFKNKFHGTIPNEIGNLEYLRFCNLFENALTGSLPTYFGKLHQLTQLHLSLNPLTGNIPTEIGKMEGLEKIFLEGNMLSGTIPFQFFNLKKLKFIYLQGNKLSGTISDKVSNFQQAESIILKSNRFSGSIPSTFGNLTNLGSLWLYWNNFEGSMPNEICSLRNYNLDQLKADCLDMFGEIAVECECCTDCCDKMQKQCYNSVN